MDMYGLIDPKFHPKLLTAAMQYSLKQDDGEQMVRLHLSQQITVSKQTALCTYFMFPSAVFHIYSCFADV